MTNRTTNRGANNRIKGNKEQRLLKQNLEWQDKLKKMPAVVFEYNRFGPLLFAFVVGAAGLYYAFITMASPVPDKKTLPDIVNLSIEPTTQRLVHGETLTLRVWADSLEQAVSAVSVRLQFPADMFEFISADTAESNFVQGAIDPTRSAAGTLALSRVSPAGLTGRQLVAEVTFRAKEVSGTGIISFSKDSALLRAGDKANILQKTSDGTYYISSR